jgi:anti-sigma factor RsiW
MTDVQCIFGVDLLADYLEDLLPADVRASLERHVLGCERCRAFIASYQATPEILREATDVVLPEDLRRSIQDWMKTWRTE